MGRLNNLPEEIILEILSRLPTESILDCKLVCKPLRDLVRHPTLSQMHLNHLSDSASADDDSCNKVGIVFFSQNKQSRKEFYYTEFDDNCDEIRLSKKTRMNLSPEIQNCNFVCSCNGLMFFYSWYGPAYICNPITREYIILPYLQGEYVWNGFGYSPSTNAYKVVRICFDSHDPNFGTALVYTVGDGNGWRNLGEMGMNWKNMRYLKLCDGVFANGTLHWVNKDNGAILAFDLTDEKFSELPSPPCLPRACGQYFTVQLGVLGDVLSATYYQYDNSNTSEIWLLEKNKQNSDFSWSKQCSFHSYIQLLLFEFKKSGRLLGCGSGDFYSYDPRASSAKINADIGILFFRAVLHKNTLVSIKTLGEKDTKTMEFRDRARSK